MARRRQRWPNRAGQLVWAGVFIGTLDLIFAMGFWALHGVAPVRIAQSIATGVLGVAAYAGGTASAVLGGLLHYSIATGFVIAYWLAGARLQRLVQQPWRHGLAYGAILYVVMNFVVLPLSAAGMPSFANRTWVVASIAMHLLVGVLCALAARRHWTGAGAPEMDGPERPLRGTSPP